MRVLNRVCVFDLIGPVWHLAISQYHSDVYEFLDLYLGYAEPERWKRYCPLYSEPHHGEVG